MKKYVPICKRSKKEQRALVAEKRVTWESISPITKTKTSKKVYSRKKSRQWKKDIPTAEIFYIHLCKDFMYSLLFPALVPLLLLFLFRVC